MTITEIAQQVWLNSHSVAFGNVACWSDDLFTTHWANARKAVVSWTSYKAGWYWFLVNMSLSELCAIQRPTSLPLKGCDIGALARANLETFGVELLCKPIDGGQLVVYNGHEKAVHARARAHFWLDNNQTGALGLKHFSLHDHVWELKIFAAPCLSAIDSEARPQVQRLMNTKSGRCAVETAWRALYGWPVLCKA